MSAPELWMFSRPDVRRIESVARQAEDDGWDGLGLTDSQNLSPDTYVALTLAARATQRLALGPGVTNPVTRHAAVTAGAIASIHQISGGRARLGIGRGDSALFNIGREPAPLALFEDYLSDVQAYLRGEVITKGGYPSRLHWLDAGCPGKVPLDVAATGPKVIAIAARHAECISFAVGADEERVRWAMRQARSNRPVGAPQPGFGLYLNVCVDDDLGRAADLARGLVGVFAHFSGMKRGWEHRADAGDRAVFRDLGEGYDRPRHGHADAAHARRLPVDFIERFAVIGSAERCLARLRALIACGVQRLFIIGPRTDRDGQAAEEAHARFVHEVMPALRSGP